MVFSTSVWARAITRDGAVDVLTISEETRLRCRRTTSTPLEDSTRCLRASGVGHTGGVVAVGGARVFRAVTDVGRTTSMASMVAVASISIYAETGANFCTTSTVVGCSTGMATPHSGRDFAAACQGETTNAALT